MLSRKGLTLLFGSIIFLIVGIYFQNFQVIVLAIFFLVFLILSTTRLPNDLSITRKTKNLKIFEDDELDMDLYIQAKLGDNKRQTLGFRNLLIEMSDTIPQHLALSRNSNYKLFQLNPNRIRKINYKLYCPLRRYYDIGPVFVRVTDEFGLFQNEFTVDNHHKFPVYIGYRTLKNFKLRTKAFDWNLGSNVLNIQGKSSDFYSLRDYTKQDSYREINWKATAKRKQLMVNTYERETLSDCCVFIDSRHICGFGRPNDNFIEYSIRLAYGLANSIISNNNRLSVVTYGDLVKVIPPGLGRNHTAYIHALLINTEPRGYLNFYSALSYAWPYLKPKSTIVIFTPIDYDDSLVSSIIFLQRLDMNIILVTSSSLNFESRAIKKFTLRNKLDDERRRVRIKELEYWGVKIVTWEPEDGFELILKKINVASGFRTFPLAVSRG